MKKFFYTACIALISFIQTAKAQNVNIPGAALSFDGVDDYVAVPNGGGLNNLQSGTIEMWVKWNGTNQDPTGNIYGPVTGRQSNFQFSNQVIALNDPNPNTAKIVWKPYGFASTAITSNTSPGNGWNHIAIVYSSGNHKLYLNGVLDGSGSEAGTMANSITTPFTLGAWIDDGNGYSNTDIDEVRIWNVMKTQAEIQASMNCELPSGTPGLIANYHFNQGLAATDNTGETTLNDTSGNGNNGILNNFALNGSSSNWVAPGGVVSGSSCLPTISIADKSVIEGNIGTVQAKIKVTLSSASTSTVTVNYTTVDSTATAGSDYVAKSGKLKFNPGQTSKTISILINGDTQVEPNEKIKILLSVPVFATIADNLGVVTIKNDDATPFSASNSINDAAIKTSVTLKVSPNPAKNLKL